MALELEVRFIHWRTLSEQDRASLVAAIKVGITSTEAPPSVTQHNILRAAKGPEPTALYDIVRIWISTPLGSAILGAVVAQALDVFIKWSKSVRQTVRGTSSPIPVVREIILYGPDGKAVKSASVHPEHGVQDTTTRHKDELLPVHF